MTASHLQFFEGQLELKSLSFLSEIDKNIHSNKTIELMNSIVSDVLDINMNILNIEATGNVGIALKMMIEFNMINSRHKKFLIILLSYYTLTNHINVPHHEKHPLLFINRAQLMAGVLNTFTKIYKDIIDSEEFNIYTTIAKPTPSFDVQCIIISDLYQYRFFNENVSGYFQRVLNDYNSKYIFGIGEYRDPSSWGESYHIKINKKVKSLIEELVPLLNDMMNT